MYKLPPARMRAFTPACLWPALWLTWSAFLTVTAASLALLARGVPGASLAGVLLAIAMLTTVLAGTATVGIGTTVGRRRAFVDSRLRLPRKAVTA